MIELTRQVAHGLDRDTDRAIVRIDPDDITMLSLTPGAVIAICGTRTALARVMPTRKPDRGKLIVQVNEILQENAGVLPGDSVTVRSIDAPVARVVEVAPLGKGPDEDILDALSESIHGLPAQRGDRVRVALFEGDILDMEVIRTAPQGPIIIGQDTKLFIGKKLPSDERPSPVASAPPRMIRYEDIGGLKPQLTRIREIVELPLQHPEIFDHLGIGAPKGVLLHGPPGCGKTLTARIIARETNASFHPISGPEIIHKFYGESEAALRTMFEKAAQESPAILFLDEIDAIAPRRENATGDVERRVVATLLTLMDGLNDRGQVIVLAATNRPNALDPALRRPGRFDREIAFTIPDTQGRREILDVHTRTMPLDEDVDLNAIARKTHGFVGADLEALCREAAMSTLRRSLPRTFEHQNIADQTGSLVISARDFHHAFQEVVPATTREVHVDVPHQSWEDIGGLGDAKRQIQEAVTWPLLHASLFQRAGVRPARGILLTGPPGCGKTLLARAAATQTDANFISVKGPALMNKYVGESERNVREIFSKARQAAPCIIFFDEIDAIATARGASHNHTSDRVLAQLLTELDGVDQHHGVLVLAATNRIDMLDQALLRAGRFDEIIEIARPSERDIADIFEVHLRRKPVAHDVNAHELARAAHDFSGAEVAEVCQRAALLAIRGVIERSSKGADELDDVHVTRFELLRAIAFVRERRS